jgi:hypothetical protein
MQYSRASYYSVTEVIQDLSLMISYLLVLTVTEIV